MSNQQSEQGTQESLSLDTIYDLLADERRRTVLSLLQNHDSLSLTELADELAQEEHGKPASDISENAVMRVYSTLWHVQIPKLAEAGVVEYNQDRDVVKFAENANRIERVLLDESTQDQTV